MWKKYLRASACALAIATASTSASWAQGKDANKSVADFYKGKKINLYIGYSAGGGYDTYARLLARYLGDNIPGPQAYKLALQRRSKGRHGDGRRLAWRGVRTLAHRRGHTV